MVDVVVVFSSRVLILSLAGTALEGLTCHSYSLAWVGWADGGVGVGWWCRESGF